MLASFTRNFGNFFFLNIVKRWVVGAEAEDAVTYCKQLSEKGSACEINRLGEHYKESPFTVLVVKDYKHLIDLLANNKMNSAITIKPSQFGFDVLDQEDPKSFCEENLLEVVKYANSKGVLTWIDMESSRFTDFTLALYKKYMSKYKLGVCLQANLKRTENDLSDLIALSKSSEIVVRLVKGIYPENQDIAITDSKQLHKQFLKLITIAFEKSPTIFGVAVATHHSEAIELALKLQKKYPKNFFEIQVLKGVLPDYYAELRNKSVPLVEYVPYGKEAFAYSVRRAKENPKLVGSILFWPFFDAYKKLYG